MVLLASVTGACGGDGGDDEVSDTTAVSEEPEPERGGNVTFAMQYNVDSFNPVTAQYNSSNHTIAKALFDPIAVLDDDGNVVPYLVESIESNDDFTEWTLTARDGIEFSNGDPLTPRDIATHIKNVQLGPLTSFGLTTIIAVGVVDEVAKPAFEAGEITQEEYDVQRRQVVVIMDEPWSAFPSTFVDTQLAYVAHPDYESGEIEEPIGTGPFVLDEFVVNDHATVVRNESYWRDGLPYLDEVEFRFLPDPEARDQALRAGDVDMINTEALDQIVELASDESLQDDYQFAEDLSDGDESTILLNTQTGPLHDLEVRRALQLATDRPALNDALYDGYYEVADTPFTTESPWYADPGWPDADADAAAAAVEEWESENGPLSIELTVLPTTDYIQLGQALQEQWENAGIDVSIESIDAPQAGTTLATGAFEAFIFVYYHGTDPDENYPFWDPNPESIGAPGAISLNFTRYTSPTMQDVMHGGRLTGDPEERAVLYAELWNDFAENVPQIWLFHVDWLVVADKDLHGLESVTTPEGTPAKGSFWGEINFTEVWRDQA